MGRPVDVKFASYRQSRRDHWDSVAHKMDSWKGWGRAYHERLIQIYRFWVAPRQRILEVGCGHGDLLASLQPSCGVGVDYSPEMVKRARILYPELEFIEVDGHDLGILDGPFDVIILSDLLDDLWDVQQVFEQLKRLCHVRTRLIINSYSRLWELPLAIAAKLRAAKPRLTQNWLTVDDVFHLLNLAGFEVIRTWQEDTLHRQYMQQDPCEDLAFQIPCHDQFSPGATVSGRNAEKADGFGDCRCPQ
jgi:ubiquinone/menaquinone biosynthesis C-methylase UbiE